MLTAWLGAGYRRRIESNHVVLEAAGPATSGVRTVIAIFNDGRVLVPFSSYAGVNSGIAIPALTTQAFREGADSLFAFNGSLSDSMRGASLSHRSRLRAMFGRAR